MPSLRWCSVAAAVLQLLLLAPPFGFVHGAAVGNEASGGDVNGMGSAAADADPTDATPALPTTTEFSEYFFGGELGGIVSIDSVVIVSNNIR